MSQLAMAGSVVPAKVRTIPIRPSGAPADAFAPSKVSECACADSAASVPEEQRDASGHPLREVESSLKATGAADRKAVRTIPVILGAPFPGTRSVRTTSLHTQSPQQDAPDMTGSANRGPAADRLGDP
jgi:hypothetical protein